MWQLNQGTKMNCWKCFRDLDLKKINYREQCPSCGIDLHVCLNCRFYSPGKPNDCVVPGTEWIKERERMNLCDEFAPKDRSLPSAPLDEAKKKARKLLGFEDDTT